MKKSFLLLTTFFLLTFSNLFSQKWSSIGIGVQNSTADYTCVYTMLEFNNELYIGGCFTSVNGVPANYIAKFDGSNWSSVGNGLWHTGNSSTIYSGVRTMAVYNGELYAGGIINESGTTPIYNVAKWNGSTWVAVGGFLANKDGVLSLCVYNNELYAGGRLGNGFNSIAKLNDTSWISLGTGIKDSIGNLGMVRDMKVYNNLLYVGGQFFTGDGTNSKNLIVWNGTNFISIGSGVNGGYGVTKMGFYNSDLVIDGGFIEINGKPFNNIARYNNTKWFPFSTGTGYSGGGSFETQTIQEYNNKMFVSGTLTIAGSTPVNNIAQWDGNSWQKVGTGTNGFVGSLTTYQNDLYVAGKFTNAGGIAVNNIAKWTESGAGVYDINALNSISIFPNPSSDKIFLKLPEFNTEFKLELYNNLGQLISSSIITEKEKEIDISNLKSGLYYIQISDGNNIEIEKFFKK